MAIEQNVQRELTPADYIAMFRRRWVLIVTLTLIGPPLAYGISRVIPSQYKSQTLRAQWQVTGLGLAVLILGHIQGQQIAHKRF